MADIAPGTPKRRRVLLVQPSFQPPGGGNAVAAWILQALQDECELGVLSWTPINLDDMNQFFGTSVRPLAFEFMPTSALVRSTLDRLPLRLALLKRALLFRAARRLGQGWDVVMTAHNEADFGPRGIQYVHHVTHRRPRPRDDVRWYHGPPFVLDAYYGLADMLAGVSLERLRQNLTLVNSDWTGRTFLACHGVTPTTLYPPVQSSFQDIPWSARINGFLCIGRISPEKELDKVIDIVSGVRRRYPDVTLRIVGTVGWDSYSHSIVERVRREGGWVSIDDHISRSALIDLMPQYRYGLHGMTDEHFGMAPAEMVSAGCIVFVPSGGGQVEIVGERTLTYGSVADAIDRILEVIASPGEQERLRAYLNPRKVMFSTERFVEAIRSIVRTFR